MQTLKNLLIKSCGNNLKNRVGEGPKNWKNKFKSQGRNAALGQTSLRKTVQPREKQHAIKSNKMQSIKSLTGV